MAAKKEKSTHSPQKLALYDALIQAVPGLERRGATMPHTSINGNMFSYLEKDGSFGLRLPDKDRELFLRKYKTELFTSFEMVMKEYVLVPENLFADTGALTPHFINSYQYTAKLKPKPGKKK